MRSKIAQRIMDETPKEVRIFVRKYGDIVVRINQLLREKGYTQKKLAEKMDKTPSEINKWLSGDHNFTLRSLAKLEAELGADIFYVPKKDSYHVQRGGSVQAVAKRSQPVPNSVLFLPNQPVKTISSNTEPVAA
jgi:transcriptional regulator with XRE-family HTH domain